jgi:hypothetical protein
MCGGYWRAMITGPVRWYRDQPLYHSAMSRSSELAAASVVASAKNMTTTQRPPGRLLRVIGRHGPTAAKFAFSPRSGHGAALLVSVHETHEAHWRPRITHAARVTSATADAL